MAMSVSYARIDLKADFRTNSSTSLGQGSPDIFGLQNGGFVSAYTNGGPPAPSCWTSTTQTSTRSAFSKRPPRAKPAPAARRLLNLLAATSW